MNEQDVRWKQRFENFNKSLNNLENALDIVEPDVTQKAGIIQLYEVCFELSWNLLKDYLEEQGFTNLKFPRVCIKKAFETDIITDGNIWMEALENRNLSSHTYDEQMAERLILKITNQFYPILKKLKNKLEQEV